jgi:hypothetical protein
MVFDQDGDAQTVSVIDIGAPWTVSKSATWIGLSTTRGTGNGSFVITPSANYGVQRSGTVTVSYGSSGYMTISITQGSNPLSVAPCCMIFDWDGGSKTVTVTCQVSWTVSKSDSWISLSATSGNGNGTFSVSAPTNTGDERYGTVTVTAGNGSSHVINITQYK